MGFANAVMLKADARPCETLQPKFAKSEKPESRSHRADQIDVGFEGCLALLKLAPEPGDFHAQTFIVVPHLARMPPPASLGDPRPDPPRDQPKEDAEHE